MGEHYTHLDIRERAVVEMNLALGKRPAQIAVYLSRSRSTITREMARNGWHAAYYDRGRRRIAAGGYRCENADLSTPAENFYTGAYRTVLCRLMW